MVENTQIAKIAINSKVYLRIPVSLSLKKNKQQPPDFYYMNYFWHGRRCKIETVSKN